MPSVTVAPEPTASVTPEPSVTPSITPEPTPTFKPTPFPTSTPFPTWGPHPTSTPDATSTPFPTSAPDASRTCTNVRGHDYSGLYRQTAYTPQPYSMVDKTDGEWAIQFQLCNRLSNGCGFRSDCAICMSGLSGSAASSSNVCGGMASTMQVSQLSDGVLFEYDTDGGDKSTVKVVCLGDGEQPHWSADVGDDGKVDIVIQHEQACLDASPTPAPLPPSPEPSYVGPDCQSTVYACAAAIDPYDDECKQIGDLVDCLKDADCWSSELEQACIESNPTCEDECKNGNSDSGNGMSTTSILLIAAGVVAALVAAGIAAVLISRRSRVPPGANVQQATATGTPYAPLS